MLGCACGDLAAIAAIAITLVHQSREAAGAACHALMCAAA
jgi:hypothetical protein